MRNKRALIARIVAVIVAIVLIISILAPIVLAAEGRHGLRGLAWLDSNRNGVRDEGEMGIAGVEVCLIQDGMVARTTYTAGDGSYAMGGIASGEYEIFMTPQTADGREYSATRQGMESALVYQTQSTEAFLLTEDRQLSGGFCAGKQAKNSALVNGDLETPAPATSAPAATPSPTASPAASPTVTPTPTATEVRLGEITKAATPLTQNTSGANTLLTLKKGQLVMVRGDVTKNCYVVKHNGVIGYVSAANIEITGRAATPADCETAVLLRKAASSKATPILRVAKKERVEVLSCYDLYYYYVRVGPYTGYVPVESFSLANETSYAAEVLPPSGYYTASLKSKASSGSSTVATYRPGTAVTILETGSTYHRVKVGSKTGYIAVRFLRPV